jgi:hypothetical protein
MTAVPRAPVLIVLACLAACAAGRTSPGEPGLGESPSTLPESITYDPSADRGLSREDCRSRFAASDVAGFVQEWFGVVAGLQLSVDANPVRQIMSDPEGARIDELRATQLCSSKILEPFRESGDPRIAELSRAMTALLADAAEAERRNAALLRSTDWTAYGTVEARARHWSEIRPSTLALSKRGAELTERIVALLREDGSASYGPGRLRISREGRDVALRHRGRLTDLTIMVEHDVDPGGPMSMTARKVLKWLYHAKGLSFASSGASSRLDLPRPAG